MKLIVKNKIENIEHNFLYAIITTNNTLYSLFPNHQDLALDLVKSKIEIINKDNSNIIIFNDINGILFLQNNIIEIIIY